ncbi:MAG: PQQ-dependent sugar dehydrogenase [Sphingopyxis sp.]|nr:PQQ-dependent sugar dehydrogenase [Sphingopyxis sp.]
MRTFIAIAPMLLLAACGGGGSGGGGGNPPPAANRPPTFTSLQTAGVTENATAAYQATASDPDGNPLTFSITGGADAARFAITPAGVVSFASPPDFDLPGDADGDNVYAITLRVSDGQASADQNVNITVANSREGIAVRRVGTGFSQPLYVAAIPGDTRVLVAEKTGGVYRLDPANGTRTLLFTAASLSTDSERGLLGLAARPDCAASQALLAVATAPDGAVQVRHYVLGTPGFTTVLSTPHADFSNHNGGWIGFGPDGHAYVGIGDGGGSGDPQNNAQNLNNRLGKILRLARNPDTASPTLYVPAPGNPFIGGGGDPWIFAYGLRNPFRASFFGNRLIIGDVGQGAREEISALTTAQGGRNFGWRFLEGTAPFNGAAPAGLTPPVAEYSHGTGPRQGNSVTGGYVYRGPVTSLQNRYVFADFVRGNIWTVPITALVDGQTLASSAFERRNEDFAPDAGSINQLVSFGEDSAGNLFIVDFDGEIFMVVAG